MTVSAFDVYIPHNFLFYLSYGIVDDIDGGRHCKELVHMTEREDLAILNPTEQYSLGRETLRTELRQQLGCLSMVHAN